MGEWGAAAVGAAVVAVVAAVAKAAEAIYKSRGAYEAKVKKAQDAAADKREGAMVKEYKELVEALRAEHEGDREQVHELRNQLHEVQLEIATCHAQRARAEERIAALEDALTAANIPHRKYQPDGSGAHQPHQSRPRGRGEAQGE